MHSFTRLQKKTEEQKDTNKHVCFGERGTIARRISKAQTQHTETKRYKDFFY